MIKITRKTTESEALVIIENGPVNPDYRKKIETPLPFLSHMIEHIVWRSGLNITAKIKTGDFYLTHVVCEDLGMALGKAFSEYIKKTTAEGCTGYGFSYGIIDEARALACISFESRAYLDLDIKCTIPSETEGMQTEDITTFIEGFVQGALCTLHIAIEKGENGHHIFEAIFRALGAALYNSAKPDSARKGMTSGVAGKIEYTVE